MIHHLFCRLVDFWHSLLGEARGIRSSYLARRPLLIALVVYGSALFTLNQTMMWKRAPAQDPVEWQGETATVTGTVCSPPDFMPRGGVCLISAETVHVGSQTFASRGKIRVQIARAQITFAEPGDRVTVHGRILRPTPARIPGTFDFDDYLAAHGVHSVLYTGIGAFHNLGDAGNHPWLRWGWRLNMNLVAAFYRRLPDEEATILSGLVAGRRPRFQMEVKRVFTESGTMHVLVASGSNIAFVVGLWYLLARIIFRLPRRLALVSSLPAVWSYAFLAGLDAPILRAAMMTSIGMLAYALSREDRPLHAFGAAVLAMLILEPRLISDLGFRMSFVTVAGLVLTLPSLSRLLPMGWRIRRTLLQLVLTSLVAEAWLLPITLSVFRRLYPLSLFANTVVVPLSGGGLLAGLLLAGADRMAHLFPFFEPSARIMASVVSVYLHLLFSLARIFADHPGRVLWASSLCPAEIVGYYLILISSLRFRDLAWAKVGIVLGLFLVAGSWIRKSPPPPIAAPQAIWLDAGRGLACLMETPDGPCALVFSSPTPGVETWEKVFMPFFAESGVRKIDFVVCPSSYSADDQRRIERWIPVGRWINSQFPQRLSKGALILETVVPEDSYTHDPPVLLRFSSGTILITKGLGLRMQDRLLQSGLANVAVMQGSFSPWTKWRSDFLRQISPEWVVENGFDSETRPSVPPWEQGELAVPQKTGFFVWRGGSKSAANYDGKN